MQLRKVIKAEQAAYIEQAIEKARHAPATHEGSLDKTGSTFFVFRTINEALNRMIALVAEGWRLNDDVPNLVQAQGVPLTITMYCSDEIFETYKADIARRAESEYLHEIEVHNKQVRAAKEREDYVEAEIQRRKDEAEAKLRAELAEQFDNIKNPMITSNGAREQGTVTGRGYRQGI